MKKIAVNVAVGVTAGFLVLAGAAPGIAAPYVTSASISVSETSPCAGSTIAVSLSGFAPGETIAISLGSGSAPVQVVTAGASGGAVVTIAVPEADRRRLVITAVGETSQLTASASLRVVHCCPQHRGNIGEGNEGSGNIGDSNEGCNNIGDSNEGENNIGDGNESGEGERTELVDQGATVRDVLVDHDSVAVWVGIGAAAAVSLVRRNRRSRA